MDDGLSLHVLFICLIVFCCLMRDGILVIVGLCDRICVSVSVMILFPGILLFQVAHVSPTLFRTLDVVVLFRLPWFPCWTWLSDKMEVGFLWRPWTRLRKSVRWLRFVCTRLPVSIPCSIELLWESTFYKYAEPRPACTLIFFWIKETNHTLELRMRNLWISLLASLFYRLFQDLWERRDYANDWKSPGYP